jgi:hypothetical protein
MEIMEILCIVFFNIFNLFPLLNDVKEKPLKLIITVVYFLIVNARIIDSLKKRHHLTVRFYQYILKACLVLVMLCEVIIPSANWFNGNKYEFLPLMINSVSCAFVNLVWTAKIYYHELKSIN